MTFADLQTGDAVFLDANTLIYHFTNHSKYGTACTALLERIENKREKAVFHESFFRTTSQLLF